MNDIDDIIWLEEDDEGEDCPFCGSTFLRFITIAGGERVACSLCHATGPSLRIKGQDHDTAIKAWNMRRGRRKQN